MSDIGHKHSHHEISRESSKRLRITLGIIFSIFILEVVGGLRSNSLALLSDAGHMLVDVLAVIISLFALSLARRPATRTRTYGFYRMEILAALANGVILIIISAAIFYEAYRRFSEPPEVESGLMLGVGIIGLIANLISLRILRGVSRESLNVKGAFWHVLGDTISSFGVVAAGIVMLTTGFTMADPIVAIIIGIIVLTGAIRLVRESADILLEAVPSNINLEELAAEMKTVSGVEEAHDLHIWTITSGILALSVHLTVEDQMVSRTSEIVEKTQDLLAEKYNITHTTIQLECEKCRRCPGGLICELEGVQQDKH
jgi:cobalt-zinc-cadmium efflux system protein